MVEDTSTFRKKKLFDDSDDDQDELNNEYKPAPEVQKYPAEEEPVTYQ
jgi:hypothetical protein